MQALITLFNPGKGKIKGESIKSLDTATVFENGNWVKKDKPSVLDKFIHGFVNKKGDHSKSLFELTGIKLSRGFLSYSFMRQYESVVDENKKGVYPTLKSLIGELAYEEYLIDKRDDIKYLTLADLGRIKLHLTTTYSPKDKALIKETIGVTDLHNIHIETDGVIKNKKKIFEGGLGGRLQAISEGNTSFDETLISTSYQDASNDIC